MGREYFTDKFREPKASKVTAEVEVSILTLRNTFKWGTARIQQGLIELPSFIKESVRCVQRIRLSREATNNVLARHGLNGYARDHKRWKFFRAKEPDELCQIDFKGPFMVHGKRNWFLVCARADSIKSVAERIGVSYNTVISTWIPQAKKLSQKLKEEVSGTTNSEGWQFTNYHAQALITRVIMTFM